MFLKSQKSQETCDCVTGMTRQGAPDPGLLVQPLTWSFGKELGWAVKPGVPTPAKWQVCPWPWGHMDTRRAALP